MLSSYILGVTLFSFCAAWLISLRMHHRDRRGEWLRVALASIGDAIIMTDARGRITSLNTVAEKLTGWTLQEARLRPAAEVLRMVNYETRIANESPVEKVLQTGSPSGPTKNTLLIARDGSERPVDDSAAPIRDRSGRIRGVTVIFRDITERYAAEQKLMESEARLKAVTNAANVGLVMIDRERRYVYVNTHYQRLLSISDSKLLGKRIEDVLPHMYDQIRPNLDRAFAGERVTYEVKGLFKDRGMNRCYSVTYEPQSRNSLILNVVIVVVEITDIKRAAAQAHEKKLGDY